MREYDQYEAADVLNRAYDTLEQGPLEVRTPCDPADDVMIRHQALRERSRDYETLRRRGQPPARQIDTARLSSRVSVEQLIEIRNETRSALEKTVGDIGRGMAEYVGKYVQELRGEIAALRRETTELQNQISVLEQQRNVERSIIAWTVDRKGFRAVPWFADGRPGPAIPLKALFAQFQSETS